MKMIWMAGVLLAVPALHAGTITNPIDDVFNFNSTATAVYQVISAGNGITSQGFIGSSTFTSETEWILAFDPLPAGATLNGASLTLTSALLTPGQLVFPGTYSTNQVNGGHSRSTEPLFSAEGSRLLVTITGVLDGFQTVNATNITAFDLGSSFANDIIAGNDLRIRVSVSDAFSTTRLASNASADNKWKNETATYNLSQTLGASFTATGGVEYTLDSPNPAVPEPLTMGLSGAGLVLLGMFRKKRK